MVYSLASGILWNSLQGYSDDEVSMTPGLGWIIAFTWNSRMQLLNYVLISQQKHKHVFSIHIIHPHWHDTAFWNPFSHKTTTHLFFIVNTMGADVLATQVVRASVTMILTYLNRDNSVPARLGLNKFNTNFNGLEFGHGWVITSHIKKIGDYLSMPQFSVKPG